MLRTIALFLAFAAPTFGQTSATKEAQIWQLEKAYWEYVKANDLEKYRALWHENFVGWPFVSSAPVRKDHITDWITANTSKESAFIPIRSSSSRFREPATSRPIIIELISHGRTARAPKSGPIECGSRTRGSERTGRGKSSEACPRP